MFVVMLTDHLPTPVVRPNMVNSEQVGQNYIIAVGKLLHDAALPACRWTISPQIKPGKGRGFMVLVTLRRPMAVDRYDAWPPTIRPIDLVTEVKKAFPEAFPKKG